MTENTKPAGPARTRKAYEPPVLHRVHLRPEEAVLGACKTSNVAGPGASTCAGGFPTCATPGS